MFGTPGETGKWGWRLEGHHLSLNYTLAEGKLSVSTGLELKGSVVLDWKNNRFDLRGTLKRKPILLTGSIQGPWWYGKKRIDPPVEILKGGDLHTFK